MAISKSLPLTLAILASGFTGMAQTPPKVPAKEKTNAAKTGDKDMNLAIQMTEKTMKGMYLTLTTLIRGGKKDDSMMISLATQGIMLDTGLEKTSVADQKYVAKLLDLGNPKSQTFAMSTKPVSKTYGDIMNFGVPITKSGKAPTAKDLAPIQKDLDLTDASIEDGPMKKYEQYEAAYNEAVEARDSERIRNLLERGDLYSAEKFTSAIEKAKRDLDAPKLGNAAVITPALERIRQFQNNDPSILWSQIVKDYGKGKTEDIYRVDTYPRPDSWAKAEGWMKFKYKATDLTDSEKYSHMDSDSTATFKNDLVDATAKAKWERTETVKMVDDKSLTIEFEMKRVFVNWPWLDSSVFSNPNWKWNSVKQGTIIADGKGGGELPYLLQSFVIVRNVTFAGNSIKDFKRNFEEKLNADVDVTVGPFSVKSEFNSHSKEDLIKKNTKESSITIPDPQIIAFVCTSVPKCPVGK